jgi:hypothetical protein
MGRTVTPTFRIEGLARRISDGRRFPLYHAWPTKHAGRPTDATLAAYVEVAEAATLAGGVNAHLGAEQITEARVIRQSTGDVVATYRPAAFQVVAEVA